MFNPPSYLIIIMGLRLRFDFFFANQIRGQWFDEYHIHAPLRKHVEGGRIVDYDDLPMGAGWDDIKVVTPAGWEYTEDDL